MMIGARLSRNDLVIQRQRGDRRRDLVVYMQTLFLRKKRRLAFDAPRLAFRRMFPMDGNVFRLTV